MDCPVELLIFMQRGDHLLKEGGVLDQPAVLWFSSNQAGYFHDILKRQSKAGTVEPDFDEDEVRIIERIAAIREPKRHA